MKIIDTAIAATGIFAAVSLTPLTAVSQERCPDASGLVAHLEKEQGQQPQALAFTARGHLVYVMVNPETGTYSIIAVSPDGRGCPVSIGFDWEWLRGDPS